MVLAGLADSRVGAEALHLVGDSHGFNRALGVSDWHQCALELGGSLNFFFGGVSCEIKKRRTVVQGA